jgi:predicted O-methyltransferase YrrM
MISGHYQGRILSFLCKLVSPKKILEIGTYTGYSAICLAEGISTDGEIHSIEINFELEELIKRNLEKAGILEKVKLYFGEAIHIIPKLEMDFDLIFIDADKVNYINYYKLLIEKLKPGGVIIADNVLWSGKVVDKDSKDKEAKKLMEFNNYVHSDNRVENILLPVRDGIILIRKL